MASATGLCHKRTLALVSRGEMIAEQSADLELTGGLSATRQPSPNSASSGPRQALQKGMNERLASYRNPMTSTRICRVIMRRLPAHRRQIVPGMQRQLATALLSHATSAQIDGAQEIVRAGGEHLGRAASVKMLLRASTTTRVRPPRPPPAITGRSIAFIGYLRTRRAERSCGNAAGF